MRLTHVIVFVSLVFLSACGSFKNKGKETKEFSAMEYPYIEAFHEGIRLKTRGQITEAITMFEKCLAMKQDDDAVYYALSELYLMKSEPIRSVEYIQKAAKLDPKNIWYIQELAYMYVEQGNNSEAVKNFELLVKEQPQNVEWLYGYAECLVKVGKVAEAIKALDRTEDQIGVYPDLSIQKFKLYVQIKQPEKGIQEIEAARKIFPDDPSLLATLVDYYFQTGKEVRAVSLLEDLVKATPENGRAHLALADVYRQQGKQAEAYVELKKAFTCDDVELDTKMKILINIHESSYKIDPEVYELVELLVIQFPLEAKAHSIRGDYMLRAEKEDEALKSYKEALKYDKKQYPIWNQVLIMEYQRTQFEELYADSKVCLEYFPTVATVYLLNGVGAVQTKRFDEAINVLETGKELVVNDKALESEMFGQLGEAYFQKNNIAEGKTNYDKALTMIDEVLKEGSESAHYLDTKGFVLFQQNKFAEAMQLFEKAFALRSNDKIITEHIGDGYLKTGNKEKAVEYWKKARELGSTNKNLDKKIEKKEYYEPIY